MDEPGSSISAVMTPGKNTMFCVAPRLFLERALGWGGQLWLQPPRSIQTNRHLSMWYYNSSFCPGVTFLTRQELG